MLTKKDHLQLNEHGLSKATIQKQIETFQKGIPFVNLAAAATRGNGILKYDENERKKFIYIYESSDKKALKFVPASGAASRMFKLLHQFVDSFDPIKNDLNEFLNQPEFKPLKPFFDQLEKLPFYGNINAEMKTSKPGYVASSEDQKKYDFADFLLNEMNYSSLPKGLIPFHHYTRKTVTAFEEHLYEATEYTSGNEKTHLHFTVAEKHLEKFKTRFEAVKTHVEKETGKHFDITYSFQEKSTDTIAVDLDNQPFRDENGALLFRPGGHGALIQNLNSIDADIVFIKNIDNVVTEENLELVSEYKKALAGILLNIQQDIFSFLKDLDNAGFSENLKEKAKSLAKNHFGQNRRFTSTENIKTYFNRPIRVCGMVKNEGEPGGGPFWVNGKNGAVSLQIIESAQIDKTDKSQAEILQNATHFNPVDLICGVKNYKGEKFDLLNFVNPDEGFISQKSKNGKTLKALELPGLWNGAMANWNTVFVEVPLATFNPVKTVVDLLKESHQPNC